MVSVKGGCAGLKEHEKRLRVHRVRGGGGEETREDACERGR